MSKTNRYWRCSTLILRHLAFAPAQIVILGGIATALTSPALAQAQQTETLTLNDALERAINSDPGLRAAAAGVEAAQGSVRQAKARPNPTLSADVENFSGKGDLRGFQGAESTYGVSQELEFGGRRSARIQLAKRELQGAELDRALRGLDLLRDVQTAYFDALAAEELASIAKERLATAQSLNTSIARRVSAARDPLLAGARAEAGLAEARIELTRADTEAATARAKLASYWGGDEGYILSRTDFALPVSEDHDHAVVTDKSPDVARLVAERERRAASVKVERSLAYQNPTLSLGYRRFEDRSGEGALVASVSVPLGIFDRNQGAIARAKSQVMQAEYDLEAGRRAIMREFAALQRTLSTDAAAVRATESEVIPQAKQALDLARNGYDRGAFSYLDVLEAQRALSDARQRRVEALRSYHSNEAALDRLTARFAEALPGEETQP